jgi:hypothetical protein
VTGTTNVSSGALVGAVVSCADITSGSIGTTGGIGSLSLSGTISPDGTEMSGITELIGFSGTHYLGTFAAGWVDHTVEANGTSVTTDPTHMGTTPADPIQVSVVSPNAGPLSIGTANSPTITLSGYSGGGGVARIVAPPATPDQPLVVTFTLDASIIPPNTPLDMIVPHKNGVAVPDCMGAPGVASPDPCVTSRFTGPNGEVIITVLSSTASVWSVGRAVVPAPPTHLAANPGDGRATVQWAKTGFIGAARITRYAVMPFLGTHALAAHTFNSAATSEVVTGLSNAKSYRFKVIATNAVGTSQASALSPAVTIGTPSAPRSPSAVPFDGVVKLNWLAPITDNGGPITGYTVTPYIAGQAQPALAFPATPTTQGIKGLTRGKKFAFMLAARNSRGLGPPTALSKPVLLR